jgi:PAS domain S-box-containing protein
MPAIAVRAQPPAVHRHPVRIAGILVMALAATVLYGWALGLDALKSVLPGAVQMKANTAAGFMLAGFALAVPGRPGTWMRVLPPACGALVALLGMATLAEYLTGAGLGIDQLLFPDDAVAFNVIPGRMSPFTAWAFVATGTCLLVRRRPALAWASAVAAAQVALIGVVSFAGYLGNSAQLTTDAWVPPVAVHTAAAFVVLGAAFLLQLPGIQARAAQASGSRSERPMQLAFWCMVVVLVASCAYTFRANLMLIGSTQVLAEIDRTRLRLSELQLCLDRAALLRERLFLRQPHADAAALSAMHAECNAAVAQLAAHLPAGAAYAAELAVLRTAVEGGTALQERDAVQRATARLDAAEAARHAAQLRELAARRAAVLVSLLLTLVACITIFGGLTRTMRQKVRDSARTHADAEQQKLLLAAVITSTPDPIAYRGPGGVFLGANEAYARMVGRPVDAIVGHSLQQVFGVAAAQEYQERDQRILAGAGHAAQEAWFTAGDGSRQLVEMIHTPLCNRDGRVSGVLAVGRNVTARKLAEEASERARVLAEETAQLKTMFLANMSHEIRTPMTAVLGMIDLLAGDALTPPQQRQLEAMRTSGRHLLHIINALLDFSRLEAGVLQLEDADFALERLLGELASLLHPLAADRGLELTIDAGPEVPAFLRGDCMRLRQVLLNLAGNAIKFTPRGSVRIHVGALPAQPGQARLLFEVQDTGIGIPEDKLATLFTPFMQVDQSTAREYGGSGLGLAITARLAEAMHAGLTVSSVMGRGSTFRLEISLPVAAGVAHAPPPRVMLRAAHPRRILVAEDVQINRDLLAIALTRQGHHVEFAVNGAEAVEQVQSSPYDLVLMDVQMPVLDGVQATRRIRGLPPPVSGIPILGLTANVMATEQQLYLAAGMDGCLTKPIDWAQLAAAIEEHCGRRADAALVAQEATGAGERPAVLDMRRLALLRDACGEDDARALVSDGLVSVRATIASMREASLQQVAAAAHSLKGLSGTLGFGRVHDAAGRIEEAALDGRREQALIEGLPGDVEATACTLRELALLRAQEAR